MALPLHFSLHRDRFVLERADALLANLLRRSPAAAPAVEARVRRCCSHGHVFPPLAEAPEDGASVSHLCPPDAVFILDGKCEPERPATVDGADLLSRAHTLLAEVRDELGDATASAGTPGLIYAPGRRMWLVPSSAAGPLSGAAAAAAVRELGDAVGPLPSGPAANAWAWLNGEIDQAGALDLNGVLELLRQALRWVSRDPEPPEALELVMCPKCSVAVEHVDGQCPECRGEFKQVGEYSLLHKHWVYHPRLGRKRMCRIPTSAPKSEINSRLAAVGDTRCLTTFRQTKNAAEATFLILSDAMAGTPFDAINAALKDLTPPPPAPSWSPKLDVWPTDRGPQLVWPEDRRRAVTYHVWWSAQPLPRGSWDALTAAAQHATTEQNTFQISNLEGPTVHAAVGAEIAGRQLGLVYADPIPVRVAATATPAAPASVAPSAPAQCPKCKATVRPNRQFCSACGASLAAAVAPPTAVVPPTPEPAGEPFADWCRAHRSDADFFDRLATMTADVLTALGALHDRGVWYGGPLVGRVTVRDGAARLDEPRQPLPLGQPARGARALLGYVCPEFGGDGRDAAPHWDVFALGAVLLGGLTGREPPESLSAPNLPLPNPRVWVPDLPPGWGGWLERVLARDPARRFQSAAGSRQSAAESLLCCRLPTADCRPAEFRVAAAQHVGVGKAMRNPRNQDRCLFVTPASTDAEAHYYGFDSFGADENYGTAEATGGSAWVAVTDGISTVSSGELAAEAIADGVRDFARRTLVADRPPTDLVADLFEHANAALGGAIQRAAAGGATAFLNPKSSPSATLAAALLRPDAVAVGSLGDSRVYLLRGGVLEQLTVDGDQFTVYLRKGLDVAKALDEEDVKELVGWVGRFEVEPGPDGPRIRPDQPRRVTELDGFSAFALKPRPGDVFCLCSDGVSDYVDRGLIDLADLLTRFAPAEACRRLIDAANACGGEDNASVVVVRAEGKETPPADV